MKAPSIFISSQKSLIVFFAFCAFIFIFLSLDSKYLMRTYQARYGPSLSLACAGKLGPYDFSAVPEPKRSEIQAKVATFLREMPPPVRTFDCSEWPAEAQVRGFATENKYNNDAYFRNQYYLMAAVGLLWAIAGPNWAALELTSAALGLGFLISLYLLSRYFVSAWLAAAISGFVFFSSKLNFYMLTITRDYTKAFFIPFALVILLWMIERSARGVSRWYEPLALGLFLGFGYGFRQDMVAAFAISSVLILFFWGTRHRFRPFSLFSGSISGSLRSLFLMGLGFCMVASVPVLLIPVDHSPEGHILILGLFDGSFQNAGWLLGDFTYNPSYTDISGYGLIDSYVIATTGVETAPILLKEYNNLSVRMFVDYILTFPNDTLARIITIFSEIIFSKSKIFGVAAASAAAIMYFRNPRYFAVISFYMLLSAAVLSLQFQERHYYHVPMMVMVVVWSALLSSLVLLVVRRGDLRIAASFSALSNRFNEIRRTNSFLIIYSPAIIAVACALVYALTAFAQAYTASRWEAIVDRQNRVPASGIQLSFSEATKKQVASFAGVKEFPDFRSQPMKADRAVTLDMTGGYLEMVFPGKDRCPQESLSFYTAYKSYDRGLEPNFERTIKLTDGPGMRYIMPVFYSKYARIGSIEFATENPNCAPSFNWIEGFDKIRLPVFYRSIRKS